MLRDELATAIRSHQAELYRYVRYLGADTASAEDIVQETFLAAFRHPHAPGAPGEAGCAAWLRAIARNLFLQWCRRERTTPVRADSESLGRAESAWNSVSRSTAR